MLKKGANKNCLKNEFYKRIVTWMSHCNKNLYKYLMNVLYFSFYYSKYSDIGV